jgi:arylsulfatase A-like enzyme
MSGYGTILTGKTSDETDVWDNVPPDGGWGSFKASGLEQRDLPVWLRNAGYQTSLVGKYLNGYKPATVSKVPKAWSDWHALALGADGADAEGKGVAAIDALALDRCRTLLSVDDQVGRLVQALADTGRLSNTLIVFMSDNGYLLGAHRWNGKTVPYEEATHVPLVIRWDGHVPAGATDHNIVLNLDIARTFATAAGATSPGAGGADILAGGSHSEFLLEHQSEAPGQEGSVPAYCGVHTKTAVYVQYVTGEQELYDLIADPHETTNLAGDPAHAAQLARLHADAMSLCVPRPPGWTLP